MIYTKSGDKGTTSLVGGKRVKKYDLRVECYGTIDELNSYMGLIRDLIIKRESKLGKNKVETENNNYAKQLFRIINSMFNLQTIIASYPQTNEEADQNFDRFWKDFSSDLEWLEQSIDDMETQLPKLKSFVLPTGFYISSHSHVARTICRRAERQLTRLNDEHFISEKALAYINRLSDYLFCLSRILIKEYKHKEVYLQG